jgi:DNA-binding GntR family transcriptional regulator
MSEEISLQDVVVEVLNRAVISGRIHPVTHLDARLLAAALASSVGVVLREHGYEIVRAKKQ